MKTRNADMQQKAHWDNLLGFYENTLIKMPDKLKQELRAAHFGQREELCRKLALVNEQACSVIRSYRRGLNVAY